MVDKIGWTESLDLGHAAMGFAGGWAWNWVRGGARVDESRARMDRVTEARWLGDGRNHYDRCAIEGQRRE